MTLINRINRVAPADTIVRFRAAARRRFAEAVHLATGGHRLASVYLWGYCGEMLLKSAYFRQRGWSPTSPITFADLRNARDRAISTHHLTWPQPNYHDLVRWA